MSFAIHKIDIKIECEEIIMLSFESDYTTGAHPEILKRLMETNMEAASGYGTDAYTQSAMDKIKKECKLESAQVYFAVGGTQTNQLVISTMLENYEGVVAAQTGHVSAHEAGAIEYSGHKVLTIPGHMGKIDCTELKDYLTSFFGDENQEHMVFPGMVYISQPTEYGSLYSKKELEDISKVCNEFKLPLYIDGARLAYGIMSNEADFTLADMATFADAFYIGGTKVGALCGEAIVFTKSNMPKHFVTQAKQRGALLAKGKLLGLQFDTLFTNDLYWKLGKNAIQKKDRLVQILKDAGIEFFYESPTNQQFVILANSFMDKLKNEVAFSFWEKYDDNHSVVRFATSWSTTDEDLDALETVFSRVKG